jgi:hypothetical protein
VTGRRRTGLLLTLSLAACTQRRPAEDVEEDVEETAPEAREPTRESTTAATNRLLGALARRPAKGVVVLRGPVAIFADEGGARGAPRDAEGAAATFETVFAARVVEDRDDVVKVAADPSFAPYRSFFPYGQLEGWVRKSSLSPVFESPYEQTYPDGTGYAFRPGAAVVTEQDQFAVVTERLRAFRVVAAARGALGISAEARAWEAELTPFGQPLFCNGESVEKRPGTVTANCALPEDTILARLSLPRSGPREELGGRPLRDDPDRERSGAGSHRARQAHATLYGDAAWAKAPSRERKDGAARGAAVAREQRDGGRSPRAPPPPLGAQAGRAAHLWEHPGAGRRALLRLARRERTGSVDARARAHANLAAVG